ncbi:MAG: energy-coupling factor transporter transmembrane component T [Clostridia bacterium]|nr:energy-coupling factor transporter transmembrane component T [Clostridia bacterium]
MDIQFVDELACNGRTALHAAAPWSKMAAAALLLASAMASRSLASAAAVGAATVAAAMASRQPLRRTAPLALYPVLFAFLFTIGALRSNPAFAATVMIKAFTAGLITATLMTTTPFVDVFGALSRILPSMVSDALFMGYRALFILIGELQDLLTAVRLRGGAGRGLIEQLKTYGEVLGVVLIHSIDMTERMYRVMLVRGYSGKIRSFRDTRPPALIDYTLLTYGAAVLVGVFLLK